MPSVIPSPTTAAARPVRAVALPAVLALVASLFAAVSVATAPPAAAALQTWQGTVTSISDGDTFWVDVNGDAQKIRVIGIDTNEVGYCWASSASNRLAQLIDGKTVRLEARSASSSSLDRLLRHVFVRINGTWTNVAELMVSEGYGLPMRNAAEPDYGEDYVAAAIAPARAGLRVWEPESCGSNPISTDLQMWVNADADGDDSQNVNGEWVRINNNGSSTVSIANWILRSDGRLGDNSFIFPSGASIPAGGHIYVHSGSGSNTSTHFYWGQTEASIGNDIGIMFLRDPARNVRAWQIWPCEGGCGPTGTVVIEEVDYDAPSYDDQNLNGERVRLRNVGPSTVDLDGWSLTSGYNYYFGDRTLGPGKALELRIGSGSDSSSVVYWGRSTPALPNSGGTLRLITPDLDLSDCYDWNAGSCADDGVVGALKFWVNYDAAGSDTSNPNGEWVALENRSNDPVDLTGFELEDAPHVFTFPNFTLSPGAMVRVKIGSGTNTGSTLYWGKSSGILSNTSDSVTVKDADGDAIMRHAWPCTDCGPDSTFIIDHVQYNAPGNDLDNPNGEWIRIKNVGTETQDYRGWQVLVRGYQLTSVASRPLDPGETITIKIGSGTNSGHYMYWGKSHGIMRNSGDSVKLLSPHRETIACHSWGSVTCDAGTQSLSSVIELTANPDANGNDAANPNGEWVNVSNTGSQTVSLDGYELYTDGFEYRFDSGDTLTPGQRIRVRLGEGTDSYHYRYWGSGSHLANSEDSVDLRKVSDGSVVVSHSWPCNSPCGPRPDLDITTVQYNPDGPDDDNVNGEYIVIKNNGSTSVNVRDWQLVYKNTVQFNWAANRILDPGEKLTVYMGQGTGSNHKVFMGRTTSRLANSGGKVELLTPYKDEVSCYDWGNWTC